MRNIRITTAITVILILAKCYDAHTQGNIEYIVFPKILKVGTESVRVPPVLLRENKLIITGDFLISMSIYSDTVFRVFKLPDCKYIGNFGLQGKGPKELVYPDISGFRHEKEGCLVSDLKKVRLIRFPDRDTVNNTNIIIEKSYNIPGELFPFWHEFILNDSVICGVNRNHALREITFLNVRNNKIGSFVDYPDLYSNVPKGALWHLYQKQIAISPVKTKIAFFYSLFPLLRIYDVKNKTTIGTFLKKEQKQEKITFTKNSVKNIFELNGFYRDIAVTEKYIYGLYQVQEFVRKNEHEFRSVPISSNQIHIYSWEGKPVLKLILEDWMKVFTVTEDDKYIYFVNPEVENYLYRFRLPTTL